MLSASYSKCSWKLKNLPPFLFFFLLKIPDKSIITSIHICKKVFSVNFFFFANLFSPTLSLKSDVYLAHHIVCFDCILALTLPFLECGGGGKRRVDFSNCCVYSHLISWAAVGSLGETPKNLLKWKTTDEGRLVRLLGFYLDGPALTLFETQRE